MAYFSFVAEENLQDEIGPGRDVASEAPGISY
jgi:hypothetical protein